MSKRKVMSLGSEDNITWISILNNTQVSGVAGFSAQYLS